MRKSYLYTALGIGVVALGSLAVWFFVFRAPELRADSILAAYDEAIDYGNLTIRYPIANTLFPPEIAPPTFQWEDGGDADAWLVTVEFEDKEGRMSFDSRDAQWTPPPGPWDAIKQRSVQSDAKITVLGVRRARQDRVLSAASVRTRTSPDKVGAPIFYREVNLPFIDAVKDPSRIRWRFGDIASGKQPPIVLEKLPVCGNCHSFSRDGGVLGMDVDYANDKGSYAIMPVASEMLLDDSKIITWNDFKREDREPTFGLLSQISPDGKYAVSTVKDESVFVPTDDLAYSQLFFPIKGILAVYNRESRRFQSLPGADNPEYVQSNPVWSPDGKSIVFARSKTYRLKNVRNRQAVLLSKEDCEEFLREGKTFLFDLYRIPFNEGKGGKAEPIRGASNNGMSNYFAKFSPDGKWIIFCRAKSFMLLQPDSALYILPAEGGQERRLSCNLAGMNSWHSWSPNGRWLVFSSKGFTPYTQLFLTHLDERGESSPPVLLSWFTDPDRAANIPEFVNAGPKAIAKIREQFVDDHSYVRVASQSILTNDLDEGEAACRKALAINPKSADALCNLGVVLIRKADQDSDPAAHKAKLDQAEACFTKAVESDPKHSASRISLGKLLCLLQRQQEGLKQYREVLREDPNNFAARRPLGLMLFEMGRFDEAIEHLTAVVKIEPRDSSAEYYLGLAYQRTGKLDQAASHYESVIKCKADFVPALSGLALLRATAKEPGVRDVQAAIRIAERACQVTQFKDPGSLAVLAAAHAESGNLGEAILFARQGIDTARQTGDESMALPIQQQLAHYLQQAGQPKPQPGGGPRAARPQ